MHELLKRRVGWRHFTFGTGAGIQQQLTRSVAKLSGGVVSEHCPLRRLRVVFGKTLFQPKTVCYQDRTE